LNYGYEEWYKWYQVEPSKNWKGSDEQLKLLVGGEACLWGEYVDSNNIR
jgi:hexosaminidase